MTSQFALNLGALRELYRSREAKPSEVVAEIYRAIASGPLEPVWISLVPREVSLTRARKLEADSVAAAKPLFGVPFAVKDNIDVAGVPTTAGCPAYSYSPRRPCHRCAIAGGCRRYSDRQDQPRSVRHRAGGHTFAARRVLQCVRFALHLGRIEFRVGRGCGEGAGEFCVGHRYRGFRPRARRLQ